MTTAKHWPLPNCPHCNSPAPNIIPWSGFPLCHPNRVVWFCPKCSRRVTAILVISQNPFKAEYRLLNEEEELTGVPASCGGTHGSPAKQTERRFNTNDHR